MQGMFKGMTYGAVTIGERGQLVIPADLRKTLSIKSGDQMMIFAQLDQKMIKLMPAKEFSRFLEKAEKMMSKLKGETENKG